MKISLFQLLQFLIYFTQTTQQELSNLEFSTKNNYDKHKFSTKNKNLTKKYPYCSHSTKKVIMKRIIDHYLLQWKNSNIRKPLLLRGARQVGKTFAVQKLGETYENFVEVNFENQPNMRSIFNQDLDPQRIIQELSLELAKPIIPGQTLLFLDEIQMAPQAIIALRYFYERMPDLHIIAAGSLLDFAIQQTGVPVGRVEFMHMYPLSFIEYVAAMEGSMTIQEILKHDLSSPLFTVMHERLLRSVGQYLALGGMPEVVQNWITTKSALDSHIIHSSIILAYRYDFIKYARTLQIKYVEQIFKQIPLQLGQKFKYSLIEGDYRKRELAPALDLLITAGIARKVYYSSGQGIPLGAQIDVFDYKVIFLDAGLAQANMGLNFKDWFLRPQQEFINKGALVEAFVGQEIAVYTTPSDQNDLCYWHKDAAPHQAEIDYLVQIDNKIIPVEVKSGSGRTLKSIQYFLATHPESPYGIRFSTNNYSNYDRIHSYPLYAIAKVMTEDNPEMRAAIESLVA